jgi:hypothetical protein
MARGLSLGLQNWMKSRAAGKAPLGPAVSQHSSTPAPVSTIGGKLDPAWTQSLHMEPGDMGGNPVTPKTKTRHAMGGGAKMARNAAIAQALKGTGNY